MPLDSTYLAWVDFAGTGMAPAEFTARVERDARIAAEPRRAPSAPAARASCASTSPPRAPASSEAVRRLQAAFADLQ